MRELEEKYIDLILKRCLNFKTGNALLIYVDLKEHLEFAERVKAKAHEMGVEDIVITCNDLDEIHEYLMNTSLEDISLQPCFDRSIYLSQAEISGGEMEPFSIEIEALNERKKGREEADTRGIFERIYKGSMPAIVSGANSNSQIFYSSYLSTYIERDVKELSDAIDSLKFLRFITAVAARCGQMVNVAEIARDADINQTQAKNWLAILETLGIIFYLHPYSNNLLKRLVKTPKLYFYDTGLVCYLTKWSSAETLESGAMNGAILENYVVAEIMKTYLNCGKEPYLYYYRDKDAKEIDIVLEHDGVLNPIEIKKTSNPGTELVKVFDLLDKSSTPRAKGAVICMKPGLSAIDRENYIVPIWMI